jgi:large subunit ribosomal protein L40e
LKYITNIDRDEVDNNRKEGVNGCITIKTLSGRSFMIDAQPCDEISLIKERIFDREGIPADSLRLLYATKELYDNWTLERYNITVNSNSVLYLINRQR